MQRPNIRRRLLRRGLVVLASAALLIVGLPAVFASADPDDDSPFFTGDTNGGVKTSRTDAGKFKHCADPGKGQDFQTATPEQVGLDPKALDQLASFHLAKAQRTLYVFRFGCLVKTGPLNGVFENIPQHQWSLTKGYSTAVIGRAVTMGYFDVDDEFGKYFPGVGDERHQHVTAQQLMQHTSGVKMNWANEIPGPDIDRVAAWSSAPMEHEPGTYFSYSQNGPNTVNAMMEKAVQKHGVQGLPGLRPARAVRQDRHRPGRLPLDG